MVFIPFRLRNQKWDTYHLSGTQLWLDPGTVRLGSRRIHAESRQTRIGQVAPRDELVQRTLDGSVQWRSQSSKGRYESKMWREAGLEEPGANLNAGAAAVVDEDEVDNLEAGGFFARFGREPTGPLPTVIPAHTGGTPLGTP